MRAALTSLLFVAVGYAANAQFSITPKLGLEPSSTSINYNDLSCLSPLGTHISPQLGLRLDYKFKKTHGPYVGISTNRSVIAFRFDDPETGLTNYTASPGDRQIRVEGGYMFSTKPINFSKSSAKSSAKQSAQQSAPVKQGCGKYKYARSSSCGSKSKQLTAKNQGWNMRIQPSAGIAYNTGNKSITDLNDANYQYNAGNWKTAIVAGTDFEFGKGRDRVFTVGFQYLRAIGDIESQTISKTVGTKTTTTHLTSNTSSWNVTVGVPFTLSKTKSAAKKKEVREIYKIREIKKQCIYKSPCRRA